MARLINKNLAILRYALENNYRGVALEGGSRSGKTVASVDFQIYLASHYSDSLVINNVRETYNSFKTTLWDDYNKRLNDFGIQSPFAAKDVTTFNLLGHKINFIGADKLGKVHGMGSDFFYINEALEGIDKYFFDQLEQRCRKMWWIDYNPSASDHWVFDLEKRKDVLFLRTTLLDNPFIPYNQKKKILSYDPNNPVNVEHGTADDYMWKVYGLGLRASPEGLVFNSVNYIDEFPNDLDCVAYGMDFGESNETAIVKLGLKRGPIKHDIFLKKLFYLPTDNSQLIIDVIRKIGIDKHIWCDNNKPGWISDLRQAGITALATVKFDGSRDYWITTLKRFNIHIEKDPDFRKEQENFKYRVVDGVQLSETIKKHDHLWSASGYGCVGDFREYLGD